MKISIKKTIHVNDYKPEYRNLRYFLKDDEVRGIQQRALRAQRATDKPGFYDPITLDTPLTEDDVIVVGPNPYYKHRAMIEELQQKHISPIRYNEIQTALKQRAGGIWHYICKIDGRLPYDPMVFSTENENFDPHKFSSFVEIKQSGFQTINYQLSTGFPTYFLWSYYDYQLIVKEIYQQARQNQTKIIQEKLNQILTPEELALVTVKEA